jgi:hypothetical protein
MSRISAFAPPANLAEALERLTYDHRLAPIRTLAYTGAIRTMCSVLGRDPASVPSEMATIEAWLREVAIPIRGRSQKTIANTRSRLKAALLHLADGPRLPPHGTPLTPDWQELVDRLTDARMRNGLSRLIRIASYRGVPPSKISDDFLQDVLRGRQQINWGRNTMPFWRKTTALWNEAVSTVSGWPQVRLTPPPMQRAQYICPCGPADLLPARRGGVSELGRRNRPLLRIGTDNTAEARHCAPAPRAPATCRFHTGAKLG